MKSVNKLSIGFASGFFACSLLFGGGVALAASGVMAERSTQAIYVDGQQVQMEAYAIGGNNYVKLRDVGKAVGFNVSWDGSAVQIDSDAPYQDEATQAGKIVSLPTDGSKFVPKTGDLIPCDDGTFYEVKDTLRWENNVYAPGGLPELPAPTCDWSAFNSAALPKVEAKRYSDQYELLLYE